MNITRSAAAKVSIIIVFLALIRCIGEFFRLDYVKKESLTIETVKPFIIGAMVCAVACLVMNLLFFSGKYKWIIVLAVVAIAALFFLKFYYQIAN